jgi:hypothetical protein
MTSATAMTAAPPRRLVLGRTWRYCLLPGFVNCLGRWGCPFRVLERRRKDGTFAGWSVAWRDHGLGAGKRKPPGWKHREFQDRWEAQVASLEAFVTWINDPDQADVVARIRRDLRGRDLACFCSERSPCHADVLLVVANQDPPAEIAMPTFTRPLGRPGGTPRIPFPPEAPRAMTTIHVRGLKIANLIPADVLPADLVPPEPHPAGRAIFELKLEGSGLVVRVECNGKAVRKALKAIAEHGPDGVNVLLQGTIKPPAQPGAPFWLEGAGLSALPKAPKAAGPSEIP